MKRIFITLAIVLSWGAARATVDPEEFYSIGYVDVDGDIDDDIRDELLDEQDYETDTLPGPEPRQTAVPALKGGKQPCIYDMPYSLSGNYPNYRRLAANTAVLFAGGFTTLAILDFLPENSTAWNKKEEAEVPMAERYLNHVMDGPHWDHDKAIFNYVLHPYAGAAYFMSARSQGLNFWYSALYSFGVSTIFWEYGIEAFMEIPSIQDLIITPVVGSLLGECMYHGKRYIVEHDYRLLGWKPLGYVAAFLCDPVNEFLGYFRGNDAYGWSSRHPQKSKVDISSGLALVPDATGHAAPTLSVSLTF
ncbi:MAG: DUF3943 domain-containing protein [Bacteroidales bacterium]|nr:DUF3943 domain-containing protein [Bacteroidales bacterium]